MNPEIVEHAPIILGALSLMLGGVIGVIKGYRWFLDEIRTAINTAIDRHSEAEAVWQREVERRLGSLESKMDRLLENKSNGGE